MTGNDLKIWMRERKIGALHLRRLGGPCKDTTRKILERGDSPIPAWVEALCLAIDIRAACAADGTLREILSDQIGRAIR